MKRVLVFLLILSLLAAVPFAMVGCKKSKVNYEQYDPSKFTETLDLDADYDLIFEDDFEGELDRDLWGDTRQGTRRDGFWTKNLAYTENGNLVIRTEKRGSRWCSATRERQVTSYGGGTVTMRYDDCFPFGVVAGEFGSMDEIEEHTTDLIAFAILAKFDALAASFSTFLDKVAIPQEGAILSSVGSVALGAYTPFYETAMELYNYYSFVQETKSVSTLFDHSAVIGLDAPSVMVFGGEVDVHSVDLQKAVAHLYGFESKEALAAAAESLADAFDREDDLPAALANGCFATDNGSFVFPIAVRNDASVLLTYLILDTQGRISVWVNDTEELLRAVNYGASYRTEGAILNETYCKNILFVTGPEGIYSGAIRTQYLYMHGFGYYEIRCKLPSTVGLWHAFWMMCGDVYSVENGSADGVEIDVFEYLPMRDAINCALHWDGYDDEHKNAHMRFENTGFGADGDYHVFGVRWDEEGYAFYIDGKKVWQTTGGGVCPLEGYMLISTEYGDWGDWVGTLAEDFTSLDWLIDYVKVYDKKA